MNPNPHQTSSAPGTLLLLVALAASLLVGGLGLRNLNARRGDATKLAEVQSRNLAQAIDRNLTGILERIDLVLSTVIGELGRNRNAAGFDRARMAAFIATEEALVPEAVAIRVTDAQGRVLFGNATGDPSASLATIESFRYLKDHPEAGQFLEKPAIGVFTKQWVVRSARRYNLPDGRFGGIVVMPMLVENFRRRLAGFDVGPNGTITLRDVDGGLITRHPMPPEGPNNRIGDHSPAPELREIIRAGLPEATYFTRTPFDGVPRSYAARKIQGRPLRVGVGLAEQDYLAQWRRGRNMTVIVIGASLLGIWLLVALLWVAWRRQLGVTMALQASEERFRTYVEQSSDVIFTLDSEGRFQFVSPAWGRHFGYPASEVIGKPFVPFVHPEDVKPCAEYLGEVLTSGRSATSPPYRVRRMDGSWLWFRANGTRLLTEEGALGFMGVAHDISERKRAEEALRESEVRYRSLFNSMSDGFATVDMQGRIISFNPAFRDLLARPEGEITRLTYEDITPARWHVCEGEIIREQVMQRGYSEVYEKEYLRGDGRLVPVELKVFLSRDGAGNPLGMNAIIRDISERKQAEVERRKAQEEARRLEEQVVQAQKMESLGSLAGGVAHDMNNVIGAILGLASVEAGEAPQGSVRRERMDTIIQACQRGGSLLKGLLGFARKGLADARLLDLNILVRDQVALLERTTLQKVQLDMDLESDLPMVKGDPSALSNALMNLCVNAVDAMPEGGTLRLRTRHKEGWVRLEVEDSGSGMPPEVLARALDPFFTTKAQGKGTGLGLSTTYSTVKAHQGRMELLSQPGAGTTVSILVPASAEALPPVEISPSQGEQKILRILVVDDDELIQIALGSLLETLGHSATTVSSAEEALAALAGGLEVDCVILDMNMPGLGGAAALPKIRALRPGLPILLATGRADQTAMDLVSDSAQVLLLPKPFTLQDLRSSLMALTSTPVPA